MPLDLGKTMPELYGLNYATDYVFENFSFLSKHSLPSWVVNQDICVHAWNFNGKRGLQKYHFSIPLLDALQIASGPVIPKRTFTWSQVTQAVIQKGKSSVSKAESRYTTRLILRNSALGTRLVWESSCTVCNPASLVSAASSSWYSQWCLCRIASNADISGRFRLCEQEKRLVWKPQVNHLGCVLC